MRAVVTALPKRGRCQTYIKSLQTLRAIVTALPTGDHVKRTSKRRKIGVVSLPLYPIGSWLNVHQNVVVVPSRECVERTPKRGTNCVVSLPDMGRVKRASKRSKYGVLSLLCPIGMVLHAHQSVVTFAWYRYRFIQ